MRNLNLIFKSKLLYQLSVLWVLMIFGVACTDDYIYPDEEPEWLGASIYDYLKDQGNFDNYVRLIEDTGYEPILGRTGSKTLFVANDDAFDRFYNSNEWGVSSYDELSMAQKLLILKFGMIDNAYLIETLANYNNNGLVYGAAFRRKTSSSVFDSIPFLKGDDLPANKYYDRFRDKGIHLMKDATPSPIVHFLQKPLQNATIDDSDFEFITGESRSSDSLDAHIFSHKVIERDIVCKNGYVHVLEDVMIPPSNIAEIIFKREELSEFSSLLERFSAPYYENSLTIDYRDYNREFSDSLFEKRFFSYYGGAYIYPDGTPINEELLLPFNPEWNSFSRSGLDNSLQNDMAVILAPTNQALQDYFTYGSGIILKERYGSWENIPDDIVVLFLKRHMRESFLETVPSRFENMTDSENSPINLSTDDIIDSHVGVNGIVYETNKVYPPDDYVSVYGPVLFSENTKVFNWAIRQNDFRLYLNSLVSRYSFLVPTDQYFDNYIDPIAYGKDIPAAVKYWYNNEEETVYATMYDYDPATNTVGDSISLITDQPFIAKRLLDLLDAHVVVGDIETGKQFYITKGVNFIKVIDNNGNLTIQGGADINNNEKIDISAVYEQSNGKTYFIDKPIQTSLQSVYKVLSETPEFSAFFELLSGFPATSNSSIFVRKRNYYGIDYNIKFFNTYNYTVYVPTNEAIEEAIRNGVIKSWDAINAIEDVEIQNEEMIKLERFLRYHFQDNSVFINGLPLKGRYQTATIKTNSDITSFLTFENKYYKLELESDGGDLVLSTDTKVGGDLDGEDVAKVVTDNGLYNIMARDYVFNGNPQAYLEVDGTGVGLPFENTEITTSSSAVIHQIDNVLRFE